MEVLIGTGLGFAVAVVLFFVIRILKKKTLATSFGLRLFLVRIPKEQPKDEKKEKDFKADVDKFEQLLSTFASFKKPFVFEVAVPHVGEEIHFYFAVPRKVSEIAVKQVQGLWTGASVDPTEDDYTVFNAHGASVGAYVKQKEPYILPLRTYEEFEGDSFAAVLGGFARVNEVGEGAAIQVLARPAPKSVKKTMRKAIERLKKGEALDKIVNSKVDFSQFAGVFSPKEKERQEKERQEMGKMLVDEDAVKAIVAKVGKPLFQVNVRIVTSAGSEFQAQDILDGLAASFEQFSSPERNSLVIVKPRFLKKFFYRFIFREFDAGKIMTLSSEEVASMYHFPTYTTEAPRIKWLKSKDAPPPADLPKTGTLIGESMFRSEHRPVNITEDDRRRHVYLIGQTGTGKSTLISNMIVDDIEKGRGVALIDPHGDLVDAVLGHIPPDREDDVIHFDPGDLSRPLGLNMLDHNLEKSEERTFIVNEMQGIFNKLFSQETMGPMFEQYMRNALLLLMEDMAYEPATLIEVPRIFTDAPFRERKLARIKNPVVIDFWEKEAVKAGGEASLQNMTPYITSKFNNFISNDYMRPIIGQPKSAFNFRKAMDEQKILLVNLSKGRIGDINAGLLGMVMSGKILMAALSRVDTPEAERKDFNLFIDEFQNFTTDSISTILSEARKYRLALTMAHQFIAQLEEKIRDSVFGNVGTQVVFRVGAQDAEFLIKQFEPVFSQNDLISIDNHHAYVKLLIKGQTSKPFNIHTLPLPHGNLERANALKDHSRQRYGSSREDVEGDIYKRLRM